jgi:hypothetical protein
MAETLSEQWLTELVSACASQFALGRRAGSAPGSVRRACQWVRVHVHTSGLAYGAPGLHPAVRGEGEGGTLNPVEHAAAHLVDVVLATAVILEARPGAEHCQALAIRCLAEWSAGLDPYAGERPLGGAVELGKAVRVCLEAMTHSALGPAAQGALLCCAARAVARLARRLIRDGALTPQKRTRWRLATRAERLRVLGAVSALQHAAGWGRDFKSFPLQKKLTLAGLERADLRQLARLAGRVPSVRGWEARMVLCQTWLDGLTKGRVAMGDREGVAMLGALVMLDVRPSERLARRAERVFRDWGGESRGAVAAPAHSELVASQVAAWTSRTVLDNLDAVLNEIRETGELAALLAKAGSGNVLTTQEWRKVREQLLDVAKAVPSLAVFALPGGAFLLPLLLKVLPFDIRPSSFRARNGAAVPPGLLVPGADSKPPTEVR